MYRYTVLSPKAARSFMGLTYERYRRPITKPERPETLIVLGAYALLEPVGLLVGACDEASQMGHILSITVVAEHQSRGVGAELLRLFEDTARAQAIQSLQINYVGDNPALERALSKEGWDTPRVTGIAVECSPQAIFPSPIYQLKAVPPPDFEFFPWADLTPEDRAAIDSREAQPGGWYSVVRSTAGSVSPFIEETFMERQCSVGLRHNGDVVGWMIVHRIRDDALHFISLFLSPEYRKQNLGILLIMKAVQNVVDVYLPILPAIRVFWQFRIENAVMHQLVEEHLAPYALAFDREKCVIKSLSQS